MHSTESKLINVIEYKHSTIFKILLVGAELLGFLIGIAPFLIGFLTGTGIEFDKARSTLEFAKYLQENTPLVFWLTLILLFGVIFGLIWYQFSIFRKDLLELHAKRIYVWDGLRILGGIGIGYLIYELIIYLLINQMYFHGVFATIPYIYSIGIIIGTFLISLSDFQVVQLLFYPVFKRISKKAEIHKVTIQKPALIYSKIAKNIGLLILGLIFVIPNLIPVMGLAPSPDLQPASGYGSQEGSSFEVDTFQIENPLPEDIAACLTPYNDDNSLYIFMYLPRLGEQSFTSTPNIPIALYCHGFSGRDPVEYDHSLRTLASRGMAVIFVQYAASVNYTAIIEKVENATETNNAASYVRYNMTWTGFHTAVNILGGNNSLITSNELNETLGSDYKFDFGRFLILGHSYGGGMSLYIGIQVLSEGWASEQLIFDLEAPTTSSEWPSIIVNLSVLPDYTMVNVVGYEDDSTLSPCSGMVQHERFITRDNTINLNSVQVAYLLIRSDRYGFPRLVATHYLPNDPLINSLSQFGYYKRIDAMAGFLVADSNGDVADADVAKTYFQGGGDNMIGMGFWSDGTPILPLLYSTDPWGHGEGPNILDELLNPDHPACQ
ncbi:MAG: alpha/beta hydrolase family protein [Promethearchaeota archaeon]